MSLFEVIWVRFQHEGGSRGFHLTVSVKLLTVFKNQANTQVKVILVSIWELSEGCFCIKEREDSAISNTTSTKSMTFLKNYLLGQPQREALMNKIIISVSIWSYLSKIPIWRCLQRDSVAHVSQDYPNK